MIPLCNDIETLIYYEIFSRAHYFEKIYCYWTKNKHKVYSLSNITTLRLRNQIHRDTWMIILALRGLIAMIHVFIS